MEKPNIKQEKNYLKKIETESLTYLNSLPKKNQEEIKKGMALKLRVSKYDDKAYQISSKLLKMCSQELADEFQNILWSIKEINDRHVGDYVEDAEIVLYSDEEVGNLKNELLDWTKKYCAARLLKIKNWNEDEFKKFERLTNEAFNLFLTIWTVDPDLPEKFDNIHWIFIKPVKCYAGWYYYHNPFGKMIKIDYKAGEVEFDEQMPEGAYPQCYMLIESNNIGEENSLNSLFSVITDFDLPTNYLKNKNLHEKLNYLKEITTGIIEMRNFLLKNYNREKSKTKLYKNTYLIWEYGYDDFVGNLIIQKYERSDESDEKASIFVNQNGLFFCTFLEWLTTLTLQNELKQQFKIEPLDINIYILEKVHDKLFEFYDKIDFSKIKHKAQQKLLELQEKKDEGIEEEIGALDDEFLAWICQTVADKGVADAKQKLRIPRMNTFLKVLEEKLGCEVKKDKEGGKGSEVTVFRSGGMKVILGRHKKNPPVSTAAINRIQKRLKISDREFVEAFL
ncbi:MAG: hypothetical protein HOD92_22075 [Deltaproteobacteria bacterium]|nr:hypothetical protein [Deltaproteobacteria bacterium]